MDDTGGLSPPLTTTSCSTAQECTLEEMVQRLAVVKGRPRPSSLDKAHKAVQANLGQRRRGSSPQNVGTPEAGMEAQQPAVTLASLHTVSRQSGSPEVAPEPRALELQAPTPTLQAPPLPCSIAKISLPIFNCPT